MDNFMDKLAQKLSAQEMIKANSQAEAAELKRLQVQLEAYDEYMQEMRKLNLKSTELLEQSQQLVQEGLEKLLAAPEKEEDGSREELLGDIKTILEENNGKLREFSDSFEDYVHKENVKVYRNVQAVVVDELKAQTEELGGQIKAAEGKNSGIRALLITTLVVSGLNAVMLAVNLLAVFGII